LTNKAGPEIGSLVRKHANTVRPGDAPEKDRVALVERIANVEAALTGANETVASNMSAEINGIVKYSDGRLSAAGQFHQLFCTDTWLGEETARLVRRRLEQWGFAVDVRRQKDLRTTDINLFQSALSDTVRWLEELLLGYKEAGYHVVFNLTGGFKSVQGFLQTLASFYADETVYVFETANDLMRIPKLPVKMADEEEVLKNLTAFRRLGMSLPVSPPIRIAETLLLTLDGETQLSPWGELVWLRTKPRLYERELYESPSERVVFSKTFRRSVEGLPSDRIRLVNERVDDLARYLETNGAYHTPRLDFKPIKGKPSPPSTHECDAWSDKDAKRLFGHFEGSAYVLDKLDDGLH
jgi:putative CRISPR-associated protein (TIGR02619 family)